MRALQSVVIATAIVVTLTQPAAALTSSLPTGTQDPAFTGKPSGALPPPTPETLPKAPILSARWKTADTVMLDYIDTSLVETGFRLEQRRASGPWQAVTSLGPLAGKWGTGSSRLTGFEPRTDYCFRLVAFNAAGASSGEVCVRTTYASACGETKLEEVLAPALFPAHEVEVDCDLYLEPQDFVWRKLVFVGSRARNLTVDLNGATLSGLDGTQNEGRDMIEVRSEEVIKRDDESGISGYYRPSNITIRNGRVYGSIRLWGMAKNGEGDGDKQIVCSNNVCLKREIPGTNQLKKSSRLPDHTARVQNNAPTGIVLQNLTIYGTGRNPVYFGPGVTNSKLLDSQVLGHSNHVGIYLDAESAGNTIKGNRIDVATGDGFWTEPRPLIAIDGSARNRIINNWFSSLNHGGIYFYRNCGEGGVIRHQAPSANQVINNIFFYDQYDGDNPAVFLGSRDRQSWYEEGGPVTFCDDDDGYPYGSSFENEDVAIYNAIMQNQIFKRQVAEVVRVNNLPVNSPNFNVSNTTVTESTVQVGRTAGCYNGGGNAGLIAHGTIVATTGTGCQGTESVCQDGEIISRSFSRCGTVAPAAAVPAIRR
jgi:hypothetical protein